MPTTTKTRADTCKVVEILSEAFSITRPVEADDIPEPIYPERVERLGTPLAELQEVYWEVENGLNGPNTLLKRVEYSTQTCPECDGEGWTDEYGDVICEDCGLMLNETPMIAPEDGFIGRTSTPSSKPALNDTKFSGATSEPNVQ